MNDHQKNAQYSGMRDGEAPPDRNVQPILWCGSMLLYNRFVVALVDTVFVMSTVSKGAINERGTSRTEEL
jgi:hypothetical protein